MPHVDQNATRTLLKRLAAWFGERGRTAADRDALARMSDRELCDIGLGCLAGRGPEGADRAFARSFPF